MGHQKQLPNQLSTNSWRWFVVCLVVIMSGGLLSGCADLVPRADTVKTSDSAAPSKTETVFLADRDQVTIAVGEEELSVEVVNTQASLTQGLSGRREIGSDGMLFMFADAGAHTFWMKDMLFDLDIIWLEKNIVVGISDHVPKPVPGTALANLKRYPSPGLVDMVLELPAGEAATRNIRVGSQLVFIRR